MKKLFISLVLLIVVSTIHAQNTAVIDTFAYLKSIEARKDEFIGKPFSILLDSLKIKITHFSNSGRRTNNINKEIYTFFSPKFIIIGNKLIKSSSIVVYWATELDGNESNKIFHAGIQKTGKTGDHWSEDAIRFYSPNIIKDFRVEK